MTTPPAHIFEPFRHADGVLRCDGASMDDAAARFGTPLYVYSESGIVERFGRCTGAFASLGASLHFASKACSTLAILRLMVGLGAGLDVVSGGELERAFLAGCPMDRVIFAGVGKTEAELRAALSGAHSPLIGSGLADDGAVRARGPIGLFNIESEGELARLDNIARGLGVRARGALRVNPDVDARTHAYTTTGRKENKFGIDLARAEAVYAGWRGPSGGGVGAGAGEGVGEGGGGGGVSLVGLHAHIGSQVMEPEPFARAAREVCAAAARLRSAGAEVSVLNLGGGWGVAYRAGGAAGGVPGVGAFAEALIPELVGERERGTRVLVEPGRAIIANAAVLLTRVEYVKRGRAKRFVVLDAGMQTLLRPSLYGAFHFAWPTRVALPAGLDADASLAGLAPADLVGPVCESGDFLALDRPFPEVGEGDVVAVFSAGAYGMSMSSNYNEHPRPAEALVRSDGSVELIRRREALTDMLATELGGGMPGPGARHPGA